MPEFALILAGRGWFAENNRKTNGKIIFISKNFQMSMTQIIFT